MTRHLPGYILMLALSIALLALVLHLGMQRHADYPTAPGPVSASTPIGGDSFLAGNAFASLQQNMRQPLGLLLFQITAVVVFSRLVAVLAARVGQPRVVGEILAGIILGPSVLGLLWPDAMNFLFKPDSLAILQNVSYLGLILFMFVIGLSLDLNMLRQKANSAIVVSHVGIAFPFLLGVLLAYFTFESLAPPHISFLAFGLFMGIAMSITAFPVLARILHERRLTHSPLGTMVMACAAADDVTAWCILAAVVAVIQAGTLASAGITVLLGLAHIGLMLYVVRPMLQRLSARNEASNSSATSFLAIALIVVIASAWITEVIGLHALFGAFLAGVSMPSKASLKAALRERIEDVSLIIFLPLFFAITGLKTQVAQLNSAATWLACGLIIVVAVLGKFGGSFAAARLTGQSSSDALAIGALMNTRGLMELVVLNIGYDLGVLSPAVFTMLVLMAIVTTLMTSPALSMIQRLGPRREALQAEVYP